MTHFGKFPGGKNPPKSHMPKASGKMSSAHVLSKQKGATYAMRNAENRVGAGTRCFKNTLTKEPGKGK